MQSTLIFNQSINYKNQPEWYLLSAFSLISSEGPCRKKIGTAEFNNMIKS